MNDTDKVMNVKLFLCTRAQQTRISINKSHFILFAFKVKEHAGEERLVPYLRVTQFVTQVGCVCESGVHIYRGV